MGKNDYAAVLRARKEADRRARARVTIQQCQDIAMIALNDAFGFGEKNLHRFGEAFWAAWQEYADMTLEDAKADKDIEYTKAKVDAKLRQICGEYFAPWEERYGG